MTPSQRTGLRIGELAQRADTSSDTIRYYERLGLLEPPERTASGYRRYGDEDVGRLQFIRRAKRLGFSLRDIRGLVETAAEGQCGPLRRQVVDLIALKIAECESQLADVAAFKATLEERLRLAQQRLDEPACGCAAFPETCGCIPVQIIEIQSIASRSSAAT